jgi:hypothetical protein
MTPERNEVDVSIDLLFKAIKQSKTAETRAILSRAVFYLKQRLNKSTLDLLTSV